MNEAIIETERTFLIHMSANHVESMMKYFSLEKKDVLTWVEENASLQKSKGFSTLNVFDKKTGKYLGYCGCREINLKENSEVELIWSIYKAVPEDDIDIEVLFAVRNYMFKHFNIHTLVAVISMKDPQEMNVVEAIDMENEYSFFQGFHKFYVYVVHRSSEKFKASFGDGESGARLTSSLNRDQYAPSFIRNLRRPRPRPR